MLNWSPNSHNSAIIPQIIDNASTKKDVSVKYDM